uniref:Interleukin 18 receptor 1 n=1 Tax=Myripristis murdjan TaxID=586833 RepID=A0A667X0U1_9TELE
MNAREGEITVLKCSPGLKNVTWTNHTAQETVLTNSLLSGGQREGSLLMYGRMLVILSVSLSHEGSYSCSVRNATAVWFKLTVRPRLSKHDSEMARHTERCNLGKACILGCPTDLYIPMLQSSGTVWHKEDGSLPASFKNGYFKSVNDHDRGVYTCTRSYLYQGQLYNMTCTTALDVSDSLPIITYPRNGEVLYVDLGAPKVIDCKAIMYSDLDEVLWLKANAFLDQNDSLPVYYNSTPKILGNLTTASLIFHKVSEKDLSYNYTCTLDSPSLSSHVTIILKQRARPFSLCVILGIMGFMVTMAVTLSVIYVKLKIDITLFLDRNVMFCFLDGKSYDAYLMCYASSTGLNEKDRRLLEDTLEDEFGYNLCLFDRDVLPGEAVAEAVLDCIERSRRLVLIPSSPDPGPGSGLLSAIHEALVERQTRLVLIKTKTKEDSLPEALNLLSKTGCSVTWKGLSSLALSSSFWKQLRYHLPAPQHLKPTTVSIDNSSDC